MKRLINQQLIDWKVHPRRKPLLIRGARQVGKTYSIKQFGAENFKSVVSIDLEKRPDWQRIFESELDVKRIIAELEVVTGQRIVVGETLLFIDEIQSCPRAIMALRYFYEDLPDLHVIAAGSLLEFALRDISFPVGRIQSVELGPLCFAEFLVAIGKEVAAGIVLQQPHAVAESTHAMLLDELRRYFFIGGMPEAVKTFVATGSMKEAFAVHAEICSTYRFDFSKYSPRCDSVCLNTVLTTVAQSVGQQIKYTRLAHDYSSPTVKNALDLLVMARIVRKIVAVDSPLLPLGAQARDKIFKAGLLDIGLMQYLCGMPVESEYVQPDLLAIYRGAMAEQFVGQEMVVSQNQALYFWARHQKSSAAEVDYLALTKGIVHPVEVKSGASGSLKSLHLCLQTYPALGEAMVFSSRNFERLTEQKLVFVPLYFAFSATGGNSNGIVEQLHK